jgi:hypothetical protein
MILGLLLAVASVLATNVAFLLKHRGAVLAAAGSGAASARQRGWLVSLPGGSRSAGWWRS